jgi:NAD-dependent deacetylase
MKVMMITGAGISVGSGIDTYRGADGSYTAIEKELGMPIHELLTYSTLMNNPELIWKYWLKFALSFKDKQPAPAHQAIKSIAEQCDAFLEVTQNVDGLSIKAGIKEDHLIELHGTARRHYCTNCGRTHHLQLEADMHVPPMCYICSPEEGEIIRPDIVLFGELIDDAKYLKACEFAAKADLLIVSGTSMLFPYLMQFVGIAAENGAMIVHVDPQADTNAHWLQLAPHTSRTKPLADQVFVMRKTADEVLPALANDLRRYIADLVAMHQAGISGEIE